MIDPVVDSSPSHPPTLNIDGSRAVVRLNRPQYHNRVEADDIAALCEIFGRIQRDNSVRVLILSARGRTFCSGFNLEDLAAVASQGSAPAFAHMVDQLENLRVPTICAVNGSMYGGGTDLALACDFRIGVPGAELVMSASRIGVHYYYGGLRRFVTRLGLAAAKRLFLCAEKVSSEKLLAIGFLDEVVPSQDLEQRVNALAGTLASNAPRSVQGMKHALNRIAWGECDVEEIRSAWIASMHSADVAEGLAAHSDKRSPVFRDP